MTQEANAVATTDRLIQGLVSIVVPIYNAEAHLRETLKCIASQTYAKFEVLMIDDGSKDNSANIALSFADDDSRFVYVFQDNAGAAAARNHGIDLAHGEFIIFLDADDLFEVQMIERLHSALESDKSDVCICRANSFSQQPGSNHVGLLKKVLHRGRMAPGCYTPTKLSKFFFQRVSTVPWDKMFRFAPILKAGTRYQNLKYSNDNYFILMSLLRANSISYIDDLLVHYRVEQGSSLRDKMYLDPLCDLVMLNQLREDAIGGGWCKGSQMRASLDSLTEDMLFLNYVRLIPQSHKAALRYYSELKQHYLPLWQKDKPLRGSSFESRFKYWAVTNIQFDDFMWSLSGLGSKRAFEVGGIKARLKLYTRLLFSYFRSSTGRSENGD